jgi:cellulose synthase operon protein C
MQQAYFKFLGALVSSKSGQTYQSLEWSGENMFTLGKDKEAADIFKQIVERIDKDPPFPSAAVRSDRIVRTKMKLAAVLRG